MTESSVVAVDGTDLRMAFEFVNSGTWLENSAYVCIDTGEIYWTSLSGEWEEDEDPPDDLEDSDRYIEVPDKHKLDVGRRLVQTSVRQELPGDYDTVADLFRRRGAYGAFKELLQTRGLLERWNEFETRATDAALLAWCEKNGFRLVDKARPAVSE